MKQNKSKDENYIHPDPLSKMDAELKSAAKKAALERKRIIK